jgi:hypothetical protein
MQESLFISEPYIRQEKQVNLSFSQGLITEANKRNIQIEEAEYTRWYCIKEIIREQYLWDMRCWDKPKDQYSKEEIIEQIEKWVKNHEEGNWTYNCGHCVYCMKRLLDKKEATLEDIAGLVMRNNNIKYYNQIKTWNYGFEQ